MMKSFTQAIMRVRMPYVLFAGLWILLTDQLLGAPTPDRDVHAQWFIYKGWLFVFVLALLLASLIRFELEARKREEQMRHTQSLLLAVTEGTTDAVYVKDLQGRYLLFNAGACHIVGKTRKEVLGQDDTALFSLDDAKRIMEGDQRVLASGNPHTYEESITIGGEVHTFLASKGPVRDSQGNIIGLFGIARDITERQRAAKELRRLNRSLRAITECNQALVHSTDETELLGAVCRIVVERGGYRLAWVGFAEENEAKNVRPMAQAGFEDDYLANVNITWADSERGHGPVGTSIRTGQACVIRNILKDPSFTPWCAEAERRGYASVVGLPLIAQGKVFGSLNIYAAAPDAFDCEEVSMLADLAADLAYGVTALRLRIEHARSEVALRESECKYRDLVESANSIILRWNSEGQITFLNEFGTRFFDYSAEEVLGHHLVGTIVPHTESGGRDLQQLIEKICGDPKAFEQSINENVRRNGERVWIAWTNKMVLDEQGRLKEILSIGSDITARKQAEACIQRERDFSDTVLNSLPGVFYCFDENRKFLRWNKNFERVTGYTATELARLGPLDLIAGADKSLVEARIQEVLDKGIGEVEAEFVSKDGTCMPYYFTGRLTEIDGKRHVVGVGIDVSARKQAETALRESEAKFRVLANGTASAIFIYRGDHYLYTNPAFLTITGFSEAELLKMNFWDIAHPEFRDLVRNRGLARQQGKYSPMRYEFKILTKSGEERWLDFTDGEIEFQGRPAAVGTARDITERKRAEDEVLRLHEDLQRYAKELEERVRQRTAQLEESNKELEAFSYSVSHDLRAPLRGIDGWSQILLEDYKDRLDDQGRQYLDRVRFETKRLGQLIDDMLQLARVTRVEMRPVSVDLSTLAQTIATRIQAAQTDRQIEFSIQPGVTAHGDPQLLDVVLTNLLENACKFTSKRERARIEFGTGMEISGDSSAPAAVYYIRDNGAGFDMAYAQKLFSAFQRLHKTSEFPGTGVGLATVQRIIQRHGGRVWAHAQVDQGATFFFTLSNS